MEPHPFDELPSLLFGELSFVDAARIDRHVARCASCREDLAAMAFASATLQDVARRQQEDGRRASDVIPDEAGQHTRPNAPEKSGTVVPLDHGRSRRGVRRWTGWVAGAAAAVVVGAVAFVAGQGTLPGQGGQETVVALSPLETGVSAAGEARMRVDGAVRTMTVSTPELRGDKSEFYEVWLLDPDQGRMVSLGVLPPGGVGDFTVSEEIASQYPTIDVSAEPADGDPTHSGQSVVRGRLEGV